MVILSRWLVSLTAVEARSRRPCELGQVGWGWRELCEQGPCFSGILSGESQSLGTHGCWGKPHSLYSSSTLYGIYISICGEESPGISCAPAEERCLYYHYRNFPSAQEPRELDLKSALPAGLSRTKLCSWMEHL